MQSEARVLHKTPKTTEAAAAANDGGDRMRQNWFPFTFILTILIDRMLARVVSATVSNFTSIENF
jgi:hypothetical protein